MKKINFKPHEFVSVMIEAVASACLRASGVPDEQASLVGAGLGSMAKGFSLSDRSLTDGMFSSLEKSILSVLDSGTIELTDTCRDLLKSDLLSPKKIIEFMSRSDSVMLLKNQIIKICRQDSDCDIDTFPVAELVSDIVGRYEAEVLNNHELAAYASYCMLRNITSAANIHLANQQYASSFEEPLFLHKGIKDTRVNLKNLFVLQKYQLLKYGGSEISEDTELHQKNLQAVIADFLQKSTLPFLFIEGDAGCGKTTLVAWLNYHYSLGDKIAARIFGNRSLLTIRLRDLDKKDITENRSLSSAIRRYMNLASLDDIERIFPKAVMILDGFDELCMIEGIGVNHEELLYELLKIELKGFQFIVTTRPKFISAGINIPHEFISLLHFDSEQREQWLSQYVSEEYCDQSVDETLYAYIKSIDDDTSSCICDTPMTLYMLAAKKGSSKFLENNWALYFHIFFEELSETEYNKMFPDPDRKYAHDISRLRDVLYQVSEEIAYQMYKKGNRLFYLSDYELSSIIERLSTKIPILKSSNMQKITERCFALCCYWKADSDRGVVEFLHNNIRDFFLAEKIYREMDKIIQRVKDTDGAEPAYKMITYKLCSLFQYGIMETKVTEFIFLRAKYMKEKRKFNFAQYEYENRLITKIIVFMSREGITDSSILKEKLFINPVQRITNILTCTVQLYRHIYEAYLKKPEMIRWTAESPTASNILVSLFKPVFCQVPVTISSDYMITMGSRGIFDSLDFKARDLRNIGFQCSQMRNVDFSDAVLCGCDFSHTDLNGSKFINADVHYASLEGASLKFCDMTGADLRGTKLPDGFMSINQDEQVEHLKSLQITGLRI